MIAKVLVFYLAFLSVVNMPAQQGTVASGGDVVGPGGSMSFSIGQIDYADTPTIEEGLQHTYDNDTISAVPNTEIDNTFAVVYPNPTSSYVVLTIQCGTDKYVSYQIYNTLGKILINKTLKCLDSETIISVEELPDALYFMRVTTDFEVKTFKIIKNK